MAADTIEQKIDYKEISCQSCGSNLLVEPQMLTAICPYCASPSIIQRPPSENLPTPTFTIGFVVTQDRAIEAVSSWIGRSSVFAKSAFRKAAPELTRGVYFHAYLSNAVANADCSAGIGGAYTAGAERTVTAASVASLHSRDDFWLVGRGAFKNTGRVLSVCSWGSFR